LNLEFNKMYML